jgi:hypothetical protein
MAESEPKNFNQGSQQDQDFNDKGSKIMPFFNLPS